MKRVIADRMAAVRDDTIVVFLIGMRLNRWWKVHRWWPVARAMPRMLTELAKDPASGFLGGTGALTRNGPMLVQYWESVEKLLGGKAAAGIAKHKPRSQNQAPAARKIWRSDLPGFFGPIEARKQPPRSRCWLSCASP